MRWRQASFYIGVTAVQCLVLLGLWSGQLQLWWPSIAEWFLYYLIAFYEWLLPLLVKIEPYVTDTLVWAHSTLTAMGLTQYINLETAMGTLELLLGTVEFALDYVTMLGSVLLAYLIIAAVGPVPASVQLSRPDEELKTVYGAATTNAEEEEEGVDGELHLMRPSVSNGHVMYIRT